MRSLVINCYRAIDLIAEDGQSLDYSRISQLSPVDSFRARPRAVFRMHLEHLAFEISKKKADLEGKRLKVELEFQGDRKTSKVPVLTAVYHGKQTAKMPIRLQTLDTEPFEKTVCKRHPDLCNIVLIFTVNESEESDAL
jgi:hypothetical protein